MVINKKNMEKHFCTSYEICIWEGVINLILFSICLAVLNSIGGEKGITIAGVKYPNNLKEYLKFFNKDDIIIIIIKILISCIDIFLY